MGDLQQPPNDTKDLFKECGTCSETFGHLLDREFGNPRPVHEHALTRLAGGIANKGYQCGMLWGATMAVGVEAAKRCDDTDEAVGLALAASRPIVASFEGRTHTVDCRDITGQNLESFWGMLGMMFTTLRKGMKNSPCFNLAEDWTPEALESARAGLEGAPTMERTPRSCASEVIKKMGGTDEEVVMAAGFGGGIGLSGAGCGALGAVMWMKGIEYVRAHDGKKPGVWADTSEKRSLKVFEEQTGGKYRCDEVCGRTFASVDEHSAFIEEGGCAALIDALAQS